MALSFASNFFMLMLLTVVPLYAVVAGHVRPPHLMVSDVIAAGPMYKAMYIFGFSYGAYGSNSIWTEVMRHVKLRAPNLRPAADRFLIMLHWVVLPCLLLLSSFSFDHEEPEYQLSHGNQISYFDTIPKSGVAFVNWLVHVLSTCLFFMGSAVCGHIWIKHIMPHLKEKGLVHPKDLQWTRISCIGLVYGFLITCLVRALHIFHNQYLWCWPLATFEVALILFCIIVNAMGTLRCLHELDQSEPMLDFKGALLP